MAKQSVTIKAAWISAGALLLVALIALIPQLRDLFKSEPPKFGITKPITRPDSGITIESLNRTASRPQPLSVEFDGFLFTNAGRLVPGSNPRRWHFILLDRSLPDSLLRDGTHKVRLSFAGEPLSEPLLVFFHTEAPIVEAKIFPQPDKPRDRIFIGRAASKLQAPGETLAVEIAFHSEGNLMKTTLPVKRVTDQANGITHYEFETTIQGLPQILPEDPRYSEPFFAFRVRDQAGNQYYQEESYAQFVAPGEKRFGVNKLADIEMRRLSPDVQQQMKVAFRLVPKPRPIPRLANGEPPIFLKVTSMARNIKQLEWTDLPKNLRTSQPLTIIFRNEREFAISFENRYNDEQAPETHEPSYRVEQMGRDNQVYSSNAN